ncbi:uncharacterized protein Dana_GF27380 [Drosophila ananassae]|uniref:Uncharacterized protein n=1 Tax=Drosophila ananassae TaxID=7217 RepID=A0A0P9C5Z1_DROAN|nr:uncharacterized protein LOC26514789 [Drosophila ananassae]KPU79074.1 uncharacterized protein Dana_GF27380 [Drosophila ananassae]
MSSKLVLTLQLFLVSSAMSFNECEFMLENDYPFTLACKGQVGAEIKQSFRDRLIKASTPYWIWMRQRPMPQMLISFHHSAISPCENVTLSLNCLHCSQSDAPGEHIDSERIHCYKKRYSYIIALLKTCGMDYKFRFENVALYYAKRGPVQASGATRAVPWGMAWSWVSWLLPE